MKNFTFYTVKKPGKLQIKFSSTSNTSVSMCLNPLLEKQHLLILLPPQLERISQTKAQDHQIDKPT